ncbi:uncharacterized protein LOC129585512 [Paramacrobiotus metropolitanus]|uniref:uncharacterized protein LOC129585512 n=1 Tax=Paramacrobiotus metropolitanus TaxID=2943436 RepID=UPI0024461A5A|nr:uncharacterized protein LOC129585512 [Paramacrobiotus metropolitanus]
MEVSSNELPFLPDEEGFHDTLYCEKCQAFLQEPCWQHAVVVQDGYSLPLAFASLPDVLTFHYNDQHQNVLQPPENCNLPSVVAQTTIRPQTVFGPFIAPLGIPGEAHSRTFSSADGQCVTFNLENDRWCNWMKLVRTVDHGQHNLRVFIREHKVLFAAVKVILPGEKLTLALYKDDVDRKEFPNDNVDYVAVCVDCAISGTEVTEDASSIKCEDDECGDARVASKSADFPLNLIAGCFSFDGDQLALALDQRDGVS